jgi:hypothetical protein
LFSWLAAHTTAAYKELRGELIKVYAHGGGITDSEDVLNLGGVTYKIFNLSGLGWCAVKECSHGGEARQQKRDRGERRTPDPDAPGGPERRQGEQDHREAETWQSVMGTDSPSSHPRGSWFR